MRDNDLEVGWVAAFILSILMMMACLVIGIIACWTHGDSAARIGGTAAIIGFPGLVMLISCSVHWWG